MDPCHYLVKYSLDVLMKKTKCLDIFKSININTEFKSLGDIDKDPFLEINGSPSLV